MTRKNNVLSQQQTIPVGPPTDALKTRFRAQSIPLNTDFAALVDVADCGRRATGQSPDFTPVDNTGLILDGNQQLKVLAGAGITVSDTGVGVLVDPYKGIDVSASGMTVKPNTALGIEVTASGVGVVANEDKGIMVDSSGVGLTGSNKVVPVGNIMMWPSDTPPSGWLLCNGEQYSASTYPLLAGLFGITSGNFTVPNFAGRYPVACNPAASDEDAELRAPNQPVTARTGLPSGFSLTLDPVGDHSHSYDYAPEAWGEGGCPEYPVGSSDAGDTNTGHSGSHTHTIPFSRGSFGPTETRPDSVCIHFIIAHD